MSSGNKQPPVRYFWKPDNIKKEDGLTRKDLIAEIEAAGDDECEKEEVTAREVFDGYACNKDMGRYKVKGKISSKNSTDKMKRRRLCDSCGKYLASSQSLWNHKRRCRELIQSKEKVPISEFIRPTILRWNGRYWETRSNNLHYQMNLGRDLSNLLDRGAIKDDSLNSTQREYIRMYKSLSKR